MREPRRLRVKGHRFVKVESGQGRIFPDNEGECQCGYRFGGRGYTQRDIRDEHRYHKQRVQIGESQ